MRDFLRGLTSGSVGTSAMTATMLVDRAIGLMSGELPPRKIARRMEEAVEMREHLSTPAFEASWLVQHFAYGALGGVAYELARRRIRLNEPLWTGPAFGTLVWAFGYAGWLPLTRLYPPPHRDHPGRATSLFLHHIVYGTTVAAVGSVLRSGQESGPGASGAVTMRSIAQDPSPAERRG